MKALEIIESAEKYRTLGRFDRKSAIDFLNDSIFDIVNRQGIYKIYELVNYDGNQIQIPNDRIIRIDIVSIEKANNFDSVRYRINPNHTIDIYFREDGETEFKKAEPSSYPSLTKLEIQYIGFTPVEDQDSDLPISDSYKQCLVYYVRSKMLEESDQIEKAAYFEGKYMQEIHKRIVPYKVPISQPNGFSLL